MKRRHQRRHIRTSRKGKKFYAGKGSKNLKSKNLKIDDDIFHDVAIERFSGGFVIFGTNQYGIRKSFSPYFTTMNKAETWLKER